MEELIRCLPIIIGVGSFVGFGVLVGFICRNEIEKKMNNLMASKVNIGEDNLKQ